MAFLKGGLKRRSLGQITGFLILMSAASRVLGYVREIVLTTVFGQGPMTDAYKAAFLIPDVLYLILIGGAFSTAFIPVLSGYFTKGQERDAWEVASTILNFVLISVTVGIGLLYFAAPWFVVHYISPGYAPETQALTIYLTRIMLIQSFFMCLSGIAQGICHVHQQFTAPAVGPLLYNIAIIVIGLKLMARFGITAFAIGVVVGSFLNFAVHIPYLAKLGFRYYPVLHLRHPGVKEFFRLALPVILGLSVIYLNTFVTQYLGSWLAPGTVTLLNNANRLMQLPIGVFAIAIATAYFPRLAESVSAGEIQAFKKQLTAGINQIFFLLVPASVGLWAVSEPLIRALYLQGRFTEENVVVTAQALALYALGIVGYSQQQMLNRGFYAVRDTRSAVLMNVVVIGVNIALSFALVGPMNFRGLALAYSVAGLLAMVLLFFVLRYKIGPFGGRHIAASLAKVLVASAVMLVAVRLTLMGLDGMAVEMKSAQLVELLLAIGVGIATFTGMALILRIDEMEEAVGMFRRKLHL